MEIEHQATAFKAASAFDPQPEFVFEINCNIEQPSLEYFNTFWTEIEEFLTSVYVSKDTNQFCYQYYYDIIESLSDSGFDENLFTKLEEFYARTFKNSLEIIASSGENFLGSVEQEWQKVNKCLSILSEVFRHFEGAYLFKTRTPNFEQFILHALADQLNTEFSTLQQALVGSLLETFADIRAGKSYDSAQLSNLMKMITKIGAYEQHFKPSFLEQSHEFFKNLRIKYHEDFNIIIFLQEIDKRITQEKILSDAYLSKATGNSLIELIQQHLITESLEDIFGKGFQDLLTSKDYENVSRVYHNILSIDKIDYIKKNWGLYIKKRGEEIINLENQDDIAQLLLDFFNELETILVKCFDNKSLLKHAKNNALEQVLSLRINTIAELTSKHIDSKLKKQNKTMQDHEQISKEVDEALELFRYLPAKDIFEAFYNKRLARRLLMNLSYSYELEKRVLDRLRTECGEQFTCKADEILKDVHQSKQMNKEFNDYLTNNSVDINKRSIFSVIVVSAAAWPMKIQPLYPLQEIFNVFQKNFETFYKSKHKGVGLKWLYETSTCDISGLFGKEKYIFQVQLIQGLILLSFNLKPKISYSELNLMIPIESEELKKNLVSLYAMKDTQKLLNKTGETKRVENDDIFDINEEYSSKKKVVKVNSIFKKETKEDVQETTDKVLTERGFVLDASIVKILKSKKSIFHNELVKELFNDLMMPVNATDVKKRIEGLIERDYIRRDAEKHALYHYVA